MRKVLFLFLLLPFIFIFGRSNTSNSGHLNPKACTPGFKFHTFGSVWNSETNFGVFGDANAGSTGNPSFDWPGGLGYYYQWEGRFWIGAKIGENVYVSHADYGNYELSPSEDPIDNCGWPNITVNKSQQDIISAYTDYEGYYNNPYKLGIKIIQKSYQWNVYPFNLMIAYEFYIIYNKNKFNITGVTAPTTLKNVLVSFCFDADNCNYDETDPHIDDMVSFDGDTRGEWAKLINCPSPTDTLTILQDTTIDEPDGKWDQYQIFGDDENEKTLKGDTILIPRNMSYIYDEDNPATPEYDKTEEGGCPGFIFGRIIYAPPAKFDIYKSPDEYGERRIPTVYSHAWWNWNNDPGTDQNKYDYMNATHSMDFGYYFMPIPYDVNAATFDYRFLLTSGPFQIADGETLKIVFVAGVGYGLNGGFDSKFGNGYVLGARQVADAGMTAYYMGSTHSDPIHPSAPNEDIHWLIPLPPEVPELTYYINEGKVELKWSNIAEIKPDPIDGLIDFGGYRVYRASWKPVTWELLADYKKTDFPSGLPHEFVDSTLVPGIPYYFTVTAYDTGRVANPPQPFIPPLETGKSNYKKDTKGAPIPLILLPPAKTSLDSVKVVPNPYYGSASWEAMYENKIAFTNLPANSRIIIYTISGDKIYQMENRSPNGTLFWNLVSKGDIDVASGLYIYKVEQFNDQKEIVDYKVDKFIILR